MSVHAARRLQRCRAISVNYVDDQTTQRTARVVLRGGPRVVADQQREVNGQIQSLTGAGTNEPRTVVGAGGKLGRTDPRHEGRLYAVSDRSM